MIFVLTIPLIYAMIVIPVTIKMVRDASKR